MSNKTTYNKIKLTADDIEKLNLNQQQKLTELGAQLALKKKEEDDRLNKYNELKKHLKGKYSKENDTFSFNNENSKIKEFLDLNDHYFKKMNNEIEELKLHQETLEEDQELSIKEIEDLEEKNKKRETYWLNRVNKLRYKCLYKNKLIKILQVLLILINLITYDLSVNGYNSYVFYFTNELFNYIYYVLNLKVYYITLFLSFILNNMYLLIIYIFGSIYNLLVNLFFNLFNPTEL